jgi:fucokinase
MWTLRGVGFTHSELVHSVLLAEQTMSCGGGWQDNVNGLCPGGFKMGQSGLGRTDEEPPEKVTFQTIKVDAAFTSDFERQTRLLLPRRDLTRLAKPILRV